MSKYSISERTAFYVDILDSIGNYEAILCERIKNALDESESREFLMDISNAFDNLVKCASDKVSESIRVNLAFQRFNEDDDDEKRNSII